MADDETTERNPTATRNERGSRGSWMSHAPPDWEERFQRDQLLDAIIDTTPLQMFVMAADIRESTLLMKEAVHFEQFAKIMDKFVSAVRSGIGTPGGWFDKFTGDGFLAYWIVPSTPKDEYQQRFVEAAGNLAHTAHELIELFHRRVLEDFRRNSRNLSDGVGLLIGLDAGPGFLVEIAGEVTLVGPPVVGAVRMVNAASRPQEIFANVYLGEHLHDEQNGIYEALGMKATRESRPDEGVSERSGGLRLDVPGYRGVRGRIGELVSGRGRRRSRSRRTRENGGIFTRILIEGHDRRGCVGGVGAEEPHGRLGRRAERVDRVETALDEERDLARD